MGKITSHENVEKKMANIVKNENSENEEGKIIANTLSNLFSLKGKVAFVSGGASGIGKRIATILNYVGAEVYVADKDLEGARKVALNAIKFTKIPCHPVYIDVRDYQTVKSAFKQVKDDRGRLDILVCSAGISGAQWIESMEPELWHRVLDVNLTGVFYCCKEAVSLMIPFKWGRIITIASIAASHAPRPEQFNGGYNYSASKAGVIGLTKRLAVELAPYRITVNSISPGFFETPLTRRALQDERTMHTLLDSIPLGRVGRPEDLDGLVVYLCSTSSDYLTGQEILIDGGYSVW
ncbi:MAG: SDR family NAD(P)-dependent oxidoreductase [Candidatus Methanomethyliaceae archaeon]